MKPLKLLMVTTIVGTLRAFLLPIAAHYRSLGWQVDALASGATSCARCIEGFDRVFDASWSRDPLALRQNLKAVKELRAVAMGGGYDIVHVHTPVASLVTRFALRARSGRPLVVYTAHGFHFFRGGQPARNFAFIAIEKLAGRWTDALVVINREDEEQAHRLRLVPEGRVFYMPGIGIDLERYNLESVSESLCGKLRDQLGLRPEHKVFLQVADFIPRKRHRDLLHAFASVPSPARLLLAGGGPELESVAKLANDLGIADRVQFLGIRSDIPALIKVADALILVSEQEGLPRCVLEAMAMARPVIGTRIRGTTDLIADGAGILVPLGDISSIAAAMHSIVDYPADARKMGVRGRQLVSRYDQARILTLHDQLYEQVLR